ncbi:hypothetical protein [Mycoplasma sp. 4423]
MKIKSLLSIILVSSSVLYVSCQSNVTHKPENTQKVHDPNKGIILQQPSNPIEIIGKDKPPSTPKPTEPPAKKEAPKPDETQPQTPQQPKQSPEQKPVETKKPIDPDNNEQLGKSEITEPDKDKDSQKPDNEQKPIESEKKESQKPNTEYQFSPTEKIDSSSNLTYPGDINNPKQIFDKSSFPNSVILENSEHNINIVSNYFRTEMQKVLTYITSQGQVYSDFPKWFYPNMDENPRKSVFSYVPDLKVHLKNNDSINVLKHQIMLSHIKNNELKIQNNNLIFKKEIKNFLNKPFSKRKIRFTFIKILNQMYTQTQSQPIVIDIDLEELLKDKLIQGNINGYSFATSLDNDKIKVVLQPQNTKSFSFDDVNKDMFDKFSTITEITYLANQNDDMNFSLSEDYHTDDLYAKLASNGLAYNPKDMVYSGKRIINKQNAMFDKIKARVFVLGGGTSTMIAKVKPTDINDQRYYFITNRHVSDILNNNWGNPRIPQKLLIPDFDDKKVNSWANDISIDVERNDFILNFWQATNQYNKQGKLVSDPYGQGNLNEADISINIIDIAQLIKRAKNSNDLKVLNYLNNWKKLPNLKLSKQAKYLSADNYVKFYLSSFPQDSHAGNSGLRYREHIINRIDDIVINQQAPEFAKYGNFRSFILNDLPNNKYDLTSGASGSLVFDEDMNMVALFMQNLGDNGYGFGLLNSYDYDYLGYESENNPNSFKYKLQKEIQSHPDKFEMIDFE